MAARKATRKKQTPQPEISFESGLERLENLVDRLEQGELELEESLGVFEEGVALTKQCAGKLEAAEKRIEVLVREGGEWLAKPFSEESEAESDEEAEEF
jgi:exodeoxyribonuclease VII small subunit